MDTLKIGRGNSGLQMEELKILYSLNVCNPCSIASSPAYWEKSPSYVHNTFLPQGKKYWDPIQQQHFLRFQALWVIFDRDVVPVFPETLILKWSITCFSYLSYDNTGAQAQGATRNSLCCSKRGELEETCSRCTNTGINWQILLATHWMDSLVWEWKIFPN